MRNTRRFKIIGALVLLGGFVFSIVAVRHIKNPRVVTRAVAPNGIEFLILQTLGEPFNTSAHYRKPGGPWGWFYYDHEDWYWGKGRAVVDLKEKLIKVYRGREVVATFAWETETFTGGVFKRKTVGAQTWSAPGKDPWD